MWKAILVVSAAALVFVGAVSGASAVRFGGGGPLPGGWTHASINYVSNHTAHTLVLDRGLVTSASATGLTLREQDGSSVQVSLSSSTQVLVGGVPGTVAQIRPGEIAITQQIDGGAATMVRIQFPRRFVARLAAHR